MQTFVVRVWKPPDESEKTPERLRGVVEHLPSGRSQTFKDDGELLRFLHVGGRELELQLGHGDGGAS
jgi:hypothetical protein